MGNDSHIMMMALSRKHSISLRYLEMAAFPGLETRIDSSDFAPLILVSASASDTVDGNGNGNLTASFLQRPEEIGMRRYVIAGWSGRNKMGCEKLLMTLALGTMSIVTGVGMAAAESVPDAPKFGNYQAKGFLSDYSRISASADDDGAYRYRDHDADLRKYNALLLDRIKIWYKEDAAYKGIDPDELKMLTDYLYQAIEKAVGDTYPLVKEAGPNVVRLRIAVTDLVPNRPVVSMTTLVVPFLWLGEAGSGLAKGEAGSTVFTGEATMELEVLDSVSGDQLAAFIQTSVGKKYDWTHGVGHGVSTYFKAYSKWEYTKKAMDEWAQLLRRRFDEVHGRSSPAIE